MGPECRSGLSWWTHFYLQPVQRPGWPGLLREFQELLQPFQLVAALPERHSQFVVHAVQLEDAFVVRF